MSQQSALSETVTTQPHYFEDCQFASKLAATVEIQDTTLQLSTAHPVQI
jgi:hypothetical protein